MNRPSCSRNQGHSAGQTKTIPEVPPHAGLGLLRKTGIIHAGSFCVTDRGPSWAWSVEATWWHQRLSVKGFHCRHITVFVAKAEHPDQPTLEETAAHLNELPVRSGLQSSSIRFVVSHDVLKPI